jgi:hypothetical protein
MQWNLRRYVDGADVLVEVPGDSRVLRIPAGVAEDQSMFERALDTLNQGFIDASNPDDIERSLSRIEGMSESDIQSLAETFVRLQELYRAGRNSIWTFVFRNLVRPVWLSRQEQHQLLRA